MIYEFEDFVLDSRQRELRRGQDVVSVEPQVFDILELLVRNHHRLVSKSELIAEVWDHRLVSESTISSRISAVRRAIADGGRKRRLVQTVPRRGFRFVGVVRTLPRLARVDMEIEGAGSSSAALARFRGSSIAVLPFATSSGDDDRQDELVYGLVEDIATALSQFRWLSVASRSLSCLYKGWALDVRQVGRDLNVDYVLEGSVRKAATHLRVTARLIDTATGSGIWTHGFDLWPKDLFALQDQIVSSIVGAVGSRLEQIDIDRAIRGSPDGLDPVQCYLRGLGQVYRWSKDGIEGALDMFRETIRCDHEFAPAYAMAAYCYVQRQSYGWIGDRSQESSECASLARTAAALAGDDAAVLARAAHSIASVVGDVDSGASFIDRALKLNPKLPAAWYVSGWIQLFLGRPAEALEHLGRALRLGPFDRLAFKARAALAYGHLLMGRYDESATTALDALAARPKYLTAMRGAAASHALAGRRDEARKLIAQVRDCDPSLRISNLSHLLPFGREQDLARWAEGLRKAGLPD